MKVKGVEFIGEFQYLVYSDYPTGQVFAGR
jgi:hypothetical protein